MRWDKARRNDRVARNPYAGEGIPPSITEWVLSTEIERLLDWLGERDPSVVEAIRHAMSGSNHDLVPVADIAKRFQALPTQP
jgi:hypothetical protein